MTNHKLDEEVEDILQHYGIKGMKWDVIRTPEQIAAAGEAGAQDVGGGEGGDPIEEDEGFLDKLDDAKDFLESSLKNISGDIKKKGMSLLTSIFGKSKVTIKGVKTSNTKVTKVAGFKNDPKVDKQMATMFRYATKAKSKKEYNKMVKEYKHATRKGGTTTTFIGGSTKTVTKDGYGRGVVSKTTPLYAKNYNGEQDRKEAYKKEATRKRKERSKNPLVRWGK